MTISMTYLGQAAHGGRVLSEVTNIKISSPSSSSVLLSQTEENEEEEEEIWIIVISDKKRPPWVACSKCGYPAA